MVLLCPLELPVLKRARCRLRENLWSKRSLIDRTMATDWLMMPELKRNIVLPSIRRRIGGASIHPLWHLILFVLIIPFLPVLLTFALPCAYIVWDIFQAIIVTRILKFILVPFSCFQFLLYYCPPYEIGKEGSFLRFPLLTRTQTHHQLLHMKPQ
jgi:hypothetical protein